LSLDNIWLRSNDSLVRVSCVRFVYRSFASCIVRSFVCVFRIVCSFHFVRSCIVRSFRVSCVFRIVRVKCSFVFRSFRLRSVSIRIAFKLPYFSSSKTLLLFGYSIYSTNPHSRNSSCPLN
jgi:hypothetical protein